MCYTVDISHTCMISYPVIGVDHKIPCKASGGGLRKFIPRQPFHAFMYSFIHSFIHSLAHSNTFNILTYFLTFLFSSSILYPLSILSIYLPLHDRILYRLHKYFPPFRTKYLLREKCLIILSWFQVP